MLVWFHWFVLFLYFDAHIYIIQLTSLYILLISFTNMSNYPSMYLMLYYIHVDNLPIRRSKIAISCWTWLSDHVRGITDLVFMQNLPLWRMNMNHIVASPGCLKHAKGGRICIFLSWPWAFSNCNSSLYCSELLCFWLVSLLIILYLLSKLRDTGFGHWNWNIPTFMDDRLKKSLPEKYQFT